MKGLTKIWAARRWGKRAGYLEDGVQVTASQRKRWRGFTGGGRHVQWWCERAAMESTASLVCLELRLERTDGRVPLLFSPTAFNGPLRPKAKLFATIALAFMPKGTLRNTFLNVGYITVV
jgi:hypothetical protein